VHAVAAARGVGSMASRHAFTLAVLAAVSSLSVAALEQTYPSRPITMIVATTAGTGADTVGRVVAVRMRQSLGNVIENLSGADETIGLALAEASLRRATRAARSHRGTAATRCSRR
jgi:tripartite-type tricarboxylate transporter receptor subunit TctC